MTRTAQEYQQRWQTAMTPECTVAPWDEPLSPASCVIFESSRIVPMGEWCAFFPDFGDTVCFYRYHRIAEELESLPTADSDETDYPLPVSAPESIHWSRYRTRFSNEEIRRRRYEGERALDKLLERYLHEGYQPDMATKLIEIVNTTLLDSELRDVYVLPGDLSLLLAHIGNPFADCDFMFDEEEDGGTPGAAAFDLHAQGHREALAERLIEPEP
ncbi:MAG TPA: hypothetical protein VJR48_18380 [Ktedonobacterales bacterium]|nr:hypothetical protein [Ktedonobacterales bacterium]